MLGGVAVLVVAGIAIALLVGASPATPRKTTRASVATLGQPWGPDQKGYGKVRPTIINNGGDPTGVVSEIQWQSWGAPQALGHGTSDYVTADEPVAAGTPAPATVVAFDLSKCHGRLEYRAIEWYFPEHGETFNSRQYINTCTGTYVG